jgi:hypothetical protein
MPAHAQRAPLLTSDVGAHTPGGAGLPSRARSQSGGIGGDGPAVAGAAATGLAYLGAPPGARSASGCGSTATVPPLRAPARWATRTRGADTGLGAGRRGERGERRHARAMPAVPAATAGRSSSTAAAARHRASAGEARHHRVAGPAGGLPRLWRRDVSGVARRRAARGLRPAGAGEHSPVHRGLSSAEADHPGWPAGAGRRPAVRGDDLAPGARDGPGGSGGARLGAGAAHGLPG